MNVQLEKIIAMKMPRVTTLLVHLNAGVLRDIKEMVLSVEVINVLTFT